MELSFWRAKGRPLRPRNDDLGEDTRKHQIRRETDAKEIAPQALVRSDSRVAGRAHWLSREYYVGQAIAERGVDLEFVGQEIPELLEVAG